ncbi:hypothetical protein BZG21_36185, partial [Escherichia coli]|nr:hypothetical protein [Escherichia coli]
MGRKIGKKLFTKMNSLLLVTAMLVSVVGCSSGNSGEAAETPISSDFNKEGLPIVNNPVTLKVLTVRWGNMGDTFTQNQWLKDLE